MSRTLAELFIALNSCGNWVGRVGFAPIAWLPEWLSLTVIAIVSGALMLLCFRYTTRPEAIRHTRRQLQANVFAVSLFRDDMLVCLREQATMLVQGLCLLWHSVLPIVVLTVPMLLILSQLAAWYQWRPIKVGEEIVLTVFLKESPRPLPAIELSPIAGVEVVTGPVVAEAAGYICWNLRADQPGQHPLQIMAGEEIYEQDLVVGQALTRLATQRPARSLLAVLEHPLLPPPLPDSVVRSIELAYPTRADTQWGLPAWMFHWLWISSLTAVVLVPISGVKF